MKFLRAVLMTTDPLKTIGAERLRFKAGFFASP